MEFGYPTPFFVMCVLVSLKVEFMPKFSVRGIWQRFREAYPVNGDNSGGPITVFTGVSIVMVVDYLPGDFKSIIETLKSRNFVY